MKNCNVKNHFALGEHTSAVESVSIQVVSYSTAAGKATNSIGTDLFTTSIGSVTLIDVWKLKTKQKRFTLLNTHTLYQCLTNASHTSILRVFTGGKPQGSETSALQERGF